MELKEHLRRNIKLAFPVMITQMGQISVNIIDNIMVGGLGGKYDNIEDEVLGKTALAAASLGNSLFFAVLVFAFGFSFALSPLIAAEDSKGDKKMAANYFSHSLVLNITLSIGLFLLITFLKPLMFYMGQPADVVEKCIPYLTIMTFSMIPLMIFQTFRQLSEGLSLTIPVTIATVLSNVINITLNYGWIYGNWGFPRLEVAGAAWGTFVARLVMMIFLILVLFNFKKTKSVLQEVQFKASNFQKTIFRKIAGIGIPTALTSFFEMSAFSLAAFVCGYTFTNSIADQELAKVNLAAHQIAINLASTTFMMCTGIGVAATVRIGNQLGLKDYKTLREAGWSCILMVLSFMILCGILFIIFRYQLPTIYLDNPDVINLAASLLIIASLFQMSDGVQLVLLGALRGMTDVKIPSILTFISYWLIAIPIGVVLAIVFEMRAFGMWIGLGTGLTASAVFLMIRYNRQTKKMIRENPNAEIILEDKLKNI
ncbi:MATE family efflux transporter [Empedobacter sp. GD03739]|uniref:MATE family efflux transporter n=1 Tax=Empedobacter sp. GD03739 TaxID=2975376 RepID=UPI00244C2D6B|nr:MATE family efflux transporter [Empedobacter sp. GD03739]MDH1602072.1 MATE family efflux transporter [Empedobacter sp. GD03739]